MLKAALCAKSYFIPCWENKFRPRFLSSNFLFYYVIALLILKFVILPFNLYFIKSVFFADVSKIVLEDITNKERIDLNIPGLVQNPVLDEAAALKAKDMMEKGYFQHQSPEGKSPWYWFNVAGYDYKMAGENLAIGFVDSEEVVRAWLNSPSHRKNLLNPDYKETGIAVLKGEFQGNETVVVVQLFGTTLDANKVLASAQVTPAPAAKIINSASPLPSLTPVQKAAISPSPAPTEKILEPGVKGSVSSLNPDQEESWFFKILHFIVLKYHNFIQGMVYGSLVLVIIALFINIFVRFEIQHKDLILKTAGLVTLLLIFVFIDRDSIISIIPHHLKIY